MKDADAYRAEVLFLAGFSVRETTTILFGERRAPGAVNRLVTDLRLADIRNSEQRLARLVELDAEVDGALAGFVDWALNKSALQAAAELGALGSHRTKALNKTELRYRMDLLSLFHHARGVEPERRHSLEFRTSRGSAIAWNVENCSLQLWNTRGLMPNWAYSTGLRLRTDAQAAAFGGARSIDFTREAVDGGRAPGIGDATLDALQRLGDARAAVRFAFVDRDSPGLRWFWLEQIAIAGRSVKQVTASSSIAAVGANYLTEALEPVARVYSLAPTGTEMSERMAPWTAPSARKREDHAAPTRASW